MPIDRNNAQYITGAIYKPTQTSAPGVWDLDDQANNIAKNLWPLPPSAITRSLRINQSDSAYLNRTFTTAGNRKLWTYSLWAKKNNPTATSTLISARTGNNDDYAFFYWSSTGNLYFLQGRVGANDDIRTSVPVFRDPSAWYHFVIIYDSDNSVGADRIQTYVNGSKVTWSIGTGPMAQGFSSGWVNYNGAHEIGRKTNYQTDYSSDFMIAEVNFVDGQSVAATSFAETDPQTGVWIPKRYLGTYGTKGFRLSFANNSSTTALGYDSSGAGNNWTPNNFSVTPGTGNDSLLDVPSLYGTDTGLGGEVLGNYCTMNPLAFSNSPYYGSPANATITNGNLDCQSLVAGYRNNIGTIPFPATGKWYFEATFVSSNGSGNNQSAGILSITDPSKIYVLDLFATSASSSRKIENGTSSGAYASVGAGTVLSIAVDCDNAKAYIAINNSWIDSGNPTTVTNGYSMAAGQTYVPFFSGYNSGITSFNFGQRPVVYTAPSGFKALCTTNLPAPAIGQTAANQADNHFNVVTYTGNGTAQTITGVGFQPDLVWVKNRTGTQWHNLTDSVRGTNSQLYSNDTAIQGTASNALTSFNPDGFSVGSAGDWNGNGYSMIAWCWNAGGVSVTNNAGTNGATIASTYRANRAAGFSIVSWTGNGSSNQTIAHGLAVTPAFLIVKRRDGGTGAWRVWHKGLSGTTYYLGLEQQTSQATSSTVFNGQSSTTFTVGNDPSVNNTGTTYIAYCWTDIPGYSAFGSFSGTGSTDGAFVYTGFRPAFVMVKTYLGATDNWYVDDVKRDTYNMSGLSLMPNLANAEAVSVGGAYSFRMDMLSNGFKIRENYATTVSFIYAAFAETPARLSTAR
jgi:hypothetical protein